MEQGHQDNQECFSIPEISSPLTSCFLGADGHTSRSDAEPFPPGKDLSWRSRTSQRKAGAGFDISSAQEELFGLSSITSVSCSHLQNLPASPTLPEEMEQVDPRSRFHGTHQTTPGSSVTPHLLPTCWGPSTPKTGWSHLNLPSQRDQPLVSVCPWSEKCHGKSMPGKVL